MRPQWAFERLCQYVEYRAELRGIDVEPVAPENTSRRCSTCWFTHPITATARTSSV
ncbi:zinc ribbon domain-containing protein [Halorientalis sp.]|uniref:zinc ribbon domain-containing protein n=1 Tax=Halorientalis sp. TaxID=1931229 RepID=UPI0032C20E19